MLDSDDRQMIKKCGSTKPDKIVSSSNSLKVKFHSDSSVVMKGFRATWKQVTASSGGNIKTPNYPNSYPTNQDKVSPAPASPHHHSYLTLSDLDTGGSLRTEGPANLREF